MSGRKGQGKRNRFVTFYWTAENVAFVHHAAGCKVELYMCKWTFACFPQNICCSENNSATDITGEGWGYRAVCWEQQRDLRAGNPATVTQSIGSGCFVLSLGCCRGYTARKGLRISGVCLYKLQKTITPLLFENRPWPALHSECCSWPFNVTSHLSQSSLWPVQPRLLFQIPPDTSCRVSLKCHSCICITSNLSEPMGGVFIFSISAFL